MSSSKKYIGKIVSLLHHFYKRYKYKIKKIESKDKSGMFNDLYFFIKKIGSNNKNIRISNFS